MSEEINQQEITIIRTHIDSGCVSEITLDEALFQLCQYLPTRISIEQAKKVLLHDLFLCNYCFTYKLK